MVYKYLALSRFSGFQKIDLGQMFLDPENKMNHFELLWWEHKSHLLVDTIKGN